MQSYTILWSRVEERHNSVVPGKHKYSLHPNKEKCFVYCLLYTYLKVFFKSITYSIHFYNCDFHEKFLWVRVTIGVLKSIKKKEHEITIFFYIWNEYYF